MNAQAQRLFELLPAILRIRDQSQADVTPGLLAPEDRTALANLETKQAGGAILTPAEADTLAELRRRALGGPLANLLAVFGEQIAVLQEDLEQLYDDQFIETCADWVTPYIGDLIGYRALHGVVPRSRARAPRSPTPSPTAGARERSPCSSSLRATSPAGTRTRLSSSSDW